MKFLILVFVGLLFLRPGPVAAQACDATCTSADECRIKIEKCQEAWNQMEAAVKPHADALKKMESDIAAFQARIRVIEADSARKAVAISEGEKELSGFLDIAGARIRQFYKRTATTNPFTAFLSKINVGAILRVFAYQQAVTNEDKRVITQTALSVKDLEDKKAQLESERASLAYLKTETDKRAASVRKLVGDATAYQGQLTGIIASLTSQQQTILNARGGTFTTSVGDVPLADDPSASPNYNPGFSPAFAGFSFGAYTHRKGMSQYGAKGRAERGQSSNQILQAYYGKEPVSKDTGGDISVQGHGSMNFEDRYLMGIAEMPSNFPQEALRAQAIAARTYAYRYKQQGTAICTTQSCQVFSASKADNPPAAWRQAVNDTRGQVIEDVVTYYSSTTGGYSTTSGWDTICGNQGCWTGDAYEKIAGSPWFYKGWYTEGYLNSSAKCGRSHPWLNQEEFADILNAWRVLNNGGDAGRVLPVTINSCPISGVSGNPYSISEMREAAAARGGAFSTISSVSVTYSTNGSTNAVIVNGQSIPGDQFKQAFNLRAPGYISIRSPLFNIEKK